MDSSQFLSQQNQNIIEQFLDNIWLEYGLSDNTIISYRYDLKKFTKWLNQQNLALVDINEEDIKKYLEYRYGENLSSKSTARFCASLRKFFNYLILTHVYFKVNH